MFPRYPWTHLHWRRVEQVILCDSWGWGSSDGDFDVGKYRATAEIKQQLNQWGARLMNNARGAFSQQLPSSPGRGSTNKYKICRWRSDYWPLITCMNREFGEGIGTRTWRFTCCCWTWCGHSSPRGRTNGKICGCRRHFILFNSRRRYEVLPIF